MAELRLERHFDASPERVFAFVSEAKGLLNWWVPEGTEAGERSLDLSKPGPWRLVLTSPGGGETIMSGNVLAIDPPRSIEMTFDVAYGGMPPMPSTVRFELQPDGAGTKLTVIQSGISDDMVMMGMTRGWPTTLDRLERALSVQRSAH
jgi:uncharacterized protein YndB with AHSA1/START domain